MNKLNRSKGNVLLASIMLIALSSLIFSFLTFISTRLVVSGIRASETMSFYVAEAGLNRAIWLVKTSVADGGNGSAWRTSGYTQNFSNGQYTISVSNGALSGEILIISTGEVHEISKTIAQVLTATGAPNAFNYSIYGGSNVSLGTTYVISGSMFVNGNTVFSGSGTAPTVYHTAGKTVSGGGTNGGVPDPLPSFPVLDTTYYTNEINTALTLPVGNVTYSNTTVNLGGATMYVHGSATFSTVNFVGPGKIVATGNITISNGPNSTNNEKITMISGATISTTGNNTRLNEITYYGQTSVAFSNSYSGTGNVVLSNGNITTSGNVSVSGMIYSKTGSVTLANSTSITGSIVAAAGVTATKSDIVITQNTAAFSSNIPPGFPSETYGIKRGSWKEL